MALRLACRGRVQANPRFSRSSLSTSERAFSSAPRRREENVYFSRPNSRSQASAPPPVVVVQSDPNASGYSSTRRWPHWLLGFAAFPLFYLAGMPLYVLATASESALRDEDDAPTEGAISQDHARFLEQYYQSQERVSSLEREARRTELASVRLQGLLVDLLTSAPGPADKPGLTTAHAALRDDELLAHPPVPVPAGAGYLSDPEHASLIRVVDGQRKNRALVLGIDPPANRGSSKNDSFNAVSNVWPWLYSIAETLHHAGANADVDLPIYIWSRDWIVENSVGAEGPTFLVVTAVDVPPGFPLAQMRAVPPGEGAAGGEAATRALWMDTAGVVLRNDGGATATAPEQKQDKESG